MIIFLAIIGLIALAIAATVLVETEKFGWATIVLLVSVGITQGLHVLPIFSWIETHAITTVLYALAYITIGITWSFIKWFSFLMMARDKYRQWKHEFFTFGGLDPCLTVGPENLDDFKKFISGKRDYKYQDPIADLYEGKRPRAANNKARIVSWMSFWPCSVIGTVLNDPVRRLFNFLFTSFKALYQKISDAVFAKDLELK